MMSDDVWSERRTNPDAIDAALRRLLRERHAANRALAPARVLNLVVVVDRSRKHAISEQLQHLGPHSSSRTILCAVDGRRRTLDASAVMSYPEPPRGGFGPIHERVEIDMGVKDLPRLNTIVDPLLISELPTAVWSPRHEQAIETLLDVADVILLDSDAATEPTAGLARAAELVRSTYVVDMAWIRTTPWRARLAAAFDTPERLAALSSLTAVSIRHRRAFLAGGLLLAGWLASRLHWGTSQLASCRGGGLRAPHGPNRAGAGIEITICPVDRGRQGVDGVAVSTREGYSLSLDQARGGIRIRERWPDGGDEVSLALEAPGAAGGTLGEGLRQAMLRDPTYSPALDAARRLAAG
jgi:glucose-6-phosphate dehydrogenase assembly protein OpcA